MLGDIALKRLIVFLLFAGSILAVPTNNKIIYNWGTTVTNYPVQMGWFFHSGEIPHGKYPQVMVNGTPVTTQAELKDEWPSDNSVRFVILSFYVASMPGASGGTPGSVTLTTQQQNTCHCILDGSGTAQTSTQMLAVGYDFEAAFQLTQPHCSVRAACNTKTISARQMITDANYQIWTGGDNATTIILGDDSTARAYDVGWERDAHTGATLGQNTSVDVGASLSGSATSFHVADAAGWTAPLKASILTTNAAFDPLYIGLNQNAEQVTIGTITLDTPGCTVSPCPGTLSGVVRYIDTPNAFGTITIDATHKATVWPDLWKEPTNSKFASFRPHVIATFFPLTSQVRVRFIGEITDTERYQDMTYALLLTIGNASPATVWQQPAIYHYAATRWTMDSRDWCEALTRIAGGSEKCGAGTVTSNNAHTWSVSPTGVTAAIIYPRELWIGGDPQPISIDHNAAYLGYAGATFNYDIDASKADPKRTISEATSNARWAGECCNVHNSTGNYNQLKGGGMVGNGSTAHPANISGLTTSLYRISTLTSEMADLSPNMGQGGGGTSEDATGPWPLWLVDWMFSQNQSVDHGLRAFQKMRTNANATLNYPFHWREGKAGSVMDYGDTVGSGTGVGKPVSIVNRPTIYYALAFNGGTNSGDRITPVGATSSQYVAYQNTSCAGGWTQGFDHHVKAIMPMYVVTGDPFYMEEGGFWASWAAAGATPFSNIPPSRGTCTTGQNCYGTIPQTINQDAAGYGWAERTSGGILTHRAEVAGMQVGCATLSGGVCQPSTETKYYRNLMTNALCGMEGAKNYTAGCHTNGNTLQKAAWTWGNTNQWTPDLLAAGAGATLGLPLNAWNDTDEHPTGGADCNYGILGPNLGRGYCRNSSGISGDGVISAHSSGAAVQMLSNGNPGGPTTGTLVTCTGCQTAQALQGRLAVTAVSNAGNGEQIITVAAVPAAWTNGTIVAVQNDGGFVAGFNYGASGVWVISNVTGTTMQLTGSAAFPVGTSSYPGGFYVTDHQFTVNAAAAAAIATAGNDCNGNSPCPAAGPPGVRMQITDAPVETVIICSLVGTTANLCPLNNSAGMREDQIHFGAAYMMHTLERSQNFQFGVPFGESTLWEGGYYGAFWVNSLTDGTHTPRTDFNPYLMSLGRFPYVAPDAHTLVSTWARAQAGFGYDSQAFNRWILSGAANTNGLAYASQMNGTISWAVDFGVTNAQTALNWLNSAGNLRSQTDVNNAVDAKWLFTPHLLGACTVNTASLPIGDVSTSYTATLTSSSCGSPLTWSVTVGTLPTGLSLTGATGVIAGTPSGSPGTSNFTVQVTDGGSNTATAALSITINAAPSITSTSPLASGTTGIPYSVTLAGSGGTVPYTWTLDSGTLPTSLALSTGGVISGTPSANGTFNFVVRLTDSVSGTVTKSFAITIGSNLIIISPTSFPAWTAQVPGFSQQYVATGGTGPYTWAAVGPLPPGLSINTSTGVLSGTPGVPGVYLVTIRVTDSLTANDDQINTLSVYGIATGAGVQVNGTIK